MKLVHTSRKPIVVALLSLLTGCVATRAPEPEIQDTREWLAGDHHIHSRYSVGWDTEQEPPAPIVGGDAIYAIPMNALMARYHGLSWMAVTDHGGPNHSKVNLEQAYPEVLLSRRVVPEVTQFYALELNSPGGDHSSLIVPHTDHESEHLFELESRFDKLDAHPTDPERDAEPVMLEALRFMNQSDDKPLVIAHHPSRSATGLGEYGLYEPAEFRNWNDTAPRIAIGMAGAPGHQALALAEDGTPTRALPRGGYGRHPTMGGYDQMTARLGGFWDSMLGEGRHWWITANSDSHIHYTEGGADFWPGEYSKTYVFADRNHDSIMAAIRAGSVFVTTGDLVSELYVTARSGSQAASIGQTLEVSKGSDVTVTIRFLDPDGENHRGENPSVARVDLIVGEVQGSVKDRSTDTNPTTRVLERFGSGEWRREGAYQTMEFTVRDVQSSLYVRVRGTNTEELEPADDPREEDPWTDLWFYSNPIFIVSGG